MNFGAKYHCPRLKITTKKTKNPILYVPPSILRIIEKIKVDNAINNPIVPKIVS